MMLTDGEVIFRGKRIGGGTDSNKQRIYLAKQHYHSEVHQAKLGQLKKEELKKAKKK